MRKKITLDHLKNMKQSGTPIVGITAYDALFSKVVNDNGVDVILVGDSLGVLIAGYETTVPVTIDQMVYHTECVKRGLGHQGALLIADMPFLTYSNTKSAIKNAAKLMQAGAETIKCEGGAWLADTVYQFCRNGIPFCGHLGLTPQSVFIEGYKVYLDEKDKDKIINDVTVLTEAGMQLLVLKCVHHDVAKTIAKHVKIPVLGIGAGIHCDGQFAILYDMLGLDEGKSALLDNAFSATSTLSPQKHFRDFLITSKKGIAGAVQDYVAAVKQRQFPNDRETY